MLVSIPVQVFVRLIDPTNKFFDTHYVLCSIAFPAAGNDIIFGVISLTV